MFDRILLPTDGSELSLAAADRAIALAKLCGAPLHVVFVQEPYPYTGIGAGSPAGQQAYEAAGQRHAEEAFASVQARALGLGVALSTERVEAPSPAEAIVEATRRSGADLVVMASHGRTGVARLLLGSVTQKVLVLSSVPVMVVR